MPDKPLMLRAIELASTGQFKKVTEIRLALRDEGYSQTDAHLQGGGIRKQLRTLIAQARRVPADYPAPDIGTDDGRAC